MGKRKGSDSFIVQAGILAGAGIIVRIIGILYRSPLTSIIGDEGNGYYGTAYNIYTIILLLASYSIPSAISKVIAQRLALNEYRNAHRIFQCAFIYVIVVGGAAMNPKIIKDFRSFGIYILEGYGITECSPLVAVNRLGSEKFHSVGPAVECCEIKIDKADDEETGEILSE